MHGLTLFTTFAIAAASTASGLKLTDFESTPSSASPACENIYNATIASCGTYSSSSPCTSDCASSLSTLSPQLKSACASVSNTPGILNQLQQSPLDQILCPTAPASTQTAELTAPASDLFEGVMTLSTTALPSTASELSLDPAATTSDSVPGDGGWRNGLMLDLGPTPVTAEGHLAGDAQATGSNSIAAAAYATAVSSSSSSSSSSENGTALPLQSDGSASGLSVSWVAVLAVVGMVGFLGLI